MTSCFPDLNVWLALSDVEHIHNSAAWAWLSGLPEGSRLIFSRPTHLGLLRLLTSQGVMGDRTLTLGQAWDIYDRWLADPRVEFHGEPRGVDVGFRESTTPFAATAASKAVGDCYLLAFAKHSRATLVTFDRALYALAQRQGCAATIPK